MAKTPLFRVNKLAFIGRNVEPAGLEFPSALSFVYGASNTGKSFAVKSIDFMLGGNRELPYIIERRSYESVQLELQVGVNEIMTLQRAVGGGDFKYICGRLSAMPIAPAIHSMSRCVRWRLAI